MTIATVTINSQDNPWEVSTGILFSTLKNQTFSTAGLIANGHPVLDASGANVMVVQNSYTRPAVVTPLVMANYRISKLSHGSWANRCHGHCAILLSGGVGLNVSQSDAEFAAGPSLQVGSVLFTPAFHVARYVDLTNGVGVGSILGPNAPSTLPTSSTWTTKFGFRVSYVLPF
ncbi:MAG: hypothetical protein M3O20_00130 [Acidobacteriota bacterium]|nr:hypothetical protein [Acidobacteriota bacterium]